MLHEKLIGPQLVKKFPSLHGTQRFITMSIRTCYLFLSWSRWIQFTSLHTISLKDSFSYPPIYVKVFQVAPSGFPTKTLYAFLSYAVHATSPTHLLFLNLIILMIFSKEEVLIVQFSPVSPCVPLLSAK
jgi:hypothetical protein